MDTLITVLVIVVGVGIVLVVGIAALVVSGRCGPADDDEH